MSFQNQKQVEIDGCSYTIAHPNPEAAWEIGIELTKLIAEPVASMALSAETGDVGAALKSAMGGFTSKLSAKDSYALLKKILATVEAKTADGKGIHLSNKPAFDVHFIGKMGTMVKLAAEVVEFTHADFFAAIKDGIAKVMAKA